MKKLLSGLIMTALVASFATSAFATTVDTTGGTTGDVKATYSGEDKTDVYNVDIQWGAMEFTYNASEESWNAETHEWETQTAASWVNSGNTIEFENNSSADVSVELAYAAATGYEDISVSFTDQEFTMTAPTSTVSSTKEVTVTLSGSLSSETTTMTTIGTITATLD